LAAAAFALIFAVVDLSSASHPILSGAASFLILGALAFVVLRWGILAMAVAILVSTNIFSAPITPHSSAWYMGSAVFMLAWPLALTAWAFHTAVAGRRLWKTDLLG
jgi:hypothetical protein